MPVMTVKGSGWGWLGWSKSLNKLMYASTPNQDPLVLQVTSHHLVSYADRWCPAAPQS